MKEEQKTHRLAEIEMSVRLRNGLDKLKFETLEQAFAYPQEEWAKVKFIGKKSFNELKTIFYEHNLYETPTEEKPAQEQYVFRPKNLEELLDTLEEREKCVICHKYGLFGESPKTLELIGKIVNVNKERVGHVLKKALTKLRLDKRGRFFAFLPDPLLIDVFGTLNIKEIFDQFYRKPDLNIDLKFNHMRTRIEESIDLKNSKLEVFMKEVRDNYTRFVNVLQGSEFLQYLKHIDRMGTKLESQAVNIQSTLQIAQKMMGTEIKIPQVEFNKMLGELDVKIHQMKELFTEFSLLERDLKYLIELNAHIKPEPKTKVKKLKRIKK